jgi:hypothetical protein
VNHVIFPIVILIWLLHRDPCFTLVSSKLLYLRILNPTTTPSGRTAITRASIPQGNMRLKSGDKLKSYNHEELDGPSNGSREKEMVIEIHKSSSRKSSLEKSEEISPVTLRNTGNNDILRTITHLRSLLPHKHQNSSSSYCNDENETDEMKLYSVLTLKEFCLEANESVEKIAKFLRSGDTTDVNGKLP